MYLKGTLNLDKSWKERGQPKLLTATNISEVAVDLQVNGSKSVGEKELVQMIHKKKKKRIEDNGLYL